MVVLKRVLTTIPQQHHLHLLPFRRKKHPDQPHRTGRSRPPQWLRMFKRDTAGQGTRHTQAEQETKTLASNGSGVDPKRNSVKPKNPCPSSLISNKLQFNELAQDYFGQRENVQERGGRIPDGELLFTPEQSPHGSVTEGMVELTHISLEELLGKWSPISAAPAHFMFPHPTQEQERCFHHESGTEPPGSHSKQWAHSEPSFLSWTLKSNDRPCINRLDLNARPYQSTVRRCPVESLTSSEPVHGIESEADGTPMQTCKLEENVGRTSYAHNQCNGIPGDSHSGGGLYLTEAATQSISIQDDGDSPVLVYWHGENDVKDMHEERSFRSAGQEDRCYVCPVRLKQLTAQTAPHQLQDIGEEEDEEEEAAGAQTIYRQSLWLVYTTIEEDLPLATVELLSDLLQPGCYPPKDITSHLLRGILLRPQGPLHLCVQAFDLLIRTQRHHKADTTTIPWDWELLTSVMDNLEEDHAKRYRYEVVRMLLEYVVRTMEDDFRATLSSDAHKQSIAREFLSCNCQFTKVRDVLRWLTAAIVQSTESGDCGDGGSRDRDDHIRMVGVFQRMLHMAVEVEYSPVLSSDKLSQELLLVLLIVMPLRSHRKLLLDSLQSELLKCKLLQYLLDHSCPEKSPLPMSLRLLLHFLNHSTLSQEPADGAHRWPKWEELIDLLWMLLLSYNRVNKGDLRGPIRERRQRPTAMMPNDVVSRRAVSEAVESLLSRSRADLGQALPDHVEESLSYLQDHLLAVCQP